MSIPRPPGMAGAPPAPPDCPRLLTARARRRSWKEGRVILWWLSALAVGAITVLVTGWRLFDRARIAEFMTRGIEVPAHIVMVGDATRENAVQLANSTTEVTIAYEFKGRSYPSMKRKIVVVRGWERDYAAGPLRSANVGLPVAAALTMARAGANLPAAAANAAMAMALFPQSGWRERDRISPGMALPIRVDPDDPSRWMEPRWPLTTIDTWLLALLLAPLCGVLAMVAVIRRQAVLRTWRDEEALPATVVEARHSGAWPLSRFVRFTLSGGSDRRVFSLTVPTHSAIREKGQVFWVVAPQKRPERAIVAALYDSSAS